MNSEETLQDCEDRAELAWEKYQQEAEDRESLTQYHEDMGVHLPSWSA